MKIEKLLTNISDDDIKDGVLIIPDGVTMLLDVDRFYLDDVHMFQADEDEDTNDQDSSSLNSIIIPASITTICDGWFAGCLELTNIKVDKNNAVFCDIDGVLFSKDKTKLICYPSGRNETSYKIPQGTKVIEGSAFLNCESLTKVIIPDSVNRIEAFAIGGCYSMKRITIPSSVKCIGKMAFINMTVECHRGSVAEEYAKKYKNSCEIID